MAIAGDMSVSALRYLLECRSECEHLDYKEELHLDNDFGLAGFARDVVGMKNVGGGYLIVGVRDKTWEPIGSKQAVAEDTKELRDAVRRATGLDLEVDIVKHSIPILSEQREFTLILTRGSSKLSKRRTPSICRISFHPREKWGIRDGDIYFRKGDQTVRVKSDELEKLLLDLSETEELSALEQQQIEPSPFLIEKGLYRILPAEYERFIERPKLQENIKKQVEGDIRIWIINVYGPGGVGKSALVSWLAQHYYDQGTFEAILHLSAKETQLSETGIKSLRPTLYSLENLLDNILLLFGFEAFVNESLEERIDIARKLLSDYRTLLILDNMETIRDGRVMKFASELPPENRSKVLITSRLRTGQWERPVEINELDFEEVKEFLRIKAHEKQIGEIKDFKTVGQRVHIASGGLPLAIEWILGQYAITGNMDAVLSRVPAPDSPLLEFSFNTSWSVLSKQAQTALAVLSIFDEAPTIRLWSTALDWSTETLEKAIEQLIEVTFVYERTDDKTVQKIYSMLPITRAFARNKLAQMGDLELQATTAYIRYLQQMALVAAEMQPFSSLFDSFNIVRDTEKQAIILARKAQSQTNSYNYAEAEKLYKDALSIDPRSVYVLVNYAIFKRDIDQISEAVDLLDTAASYITKVNAFLVYYNYAQVYDKVRNRQKVEHYLRKALDYQPNHHIARHQLGVVVSRLGRYNTALAIFDELIKEELAYENGPTETLIYTYNTKMITLIKSKQSGRAREVLEEAKIELKKWPYLVSKLYILEENL